MPEYATKEELDAKTLESLADVDAPEPARGDGLGWNGSGYQNAQSVFNVKLFGATGDGATNDTPALKEAFEAAAVAGGVIHFPPGTYIYDEELIPASNCHLRGAGPDASIIKCKTGGPAFFIKGSAEKGGFTMTNPCTNFSVMGLGFDLNGQDSEFAGVIQFNAGLDRCWVKNCHFFDSNAPSRSKAIGTGDGVTRTFEYTFDNQEGEEKNRKPLSQSISITDEHGQAYVDDGMGNWVSERSPLQPLSTISGFISYGGHAVSGKLSITFPTAPPNGATIKLTYQAVRQRQHLVLLGAANVFIENNVLSHGGRIKVGRPGNRVFIRGNTLQDVNDNAITVVGTDQPAFAITSDLIISDNIIRNPVLKGIYVGADGEGETQETLTCERVEITGNIVTGDFESAVFAQFPRVTREARIDGNIARLTHPYEVEDGYAMIDIRFVNEATAPGRIISVNGNICAGMGSTTVGPGIWIRNFVGFTCIGNIITDIPVSRGIRIDSSSHGVIGDNVITNVGTPIQLTTGETSYLVFHDNDLATHAAGFGHFAIRGAKANHVLFHDNTCSGPGFGLDLRPAEEALVRIHDNDFTGCGEEKFTQEKLTIGSYVRNNAGINPSGSKTTTVPTSGEAVAADVYDREFYVTASSSSPAEMQVSGGPKVTIPKATMSLVRVPAGKAVTPTYANAPTWVVYRL